MRIKKYLKFFESNLTLLYKQMSKYIHILYYIELKIQKII